MTFQHNQQHSQNVLSNNTCFICFFYSFFNFVKLGERGVTRMFLRRNHTRFRSDYPSPHSYIWRRTIKAKDLEIQLCGLFWQWANAVHRVHNIFVGVISLAIVQIVTCGERDSHEATKKRNITVRQRKNCTSLSRHCHNSERSSIFVIDDENRYLVIATRRNRLSALSRVITRRAKRLIIASVRMKIGKHIFNILVSCHSCKRGIRTWRDRQH